MSRRHGACLVTAFSWRRGHSDRDPGHDRRGKLFLRQEVDHQDLPYNTRGGGGRGRVTGGGEEEIGSEGGGRGGGWGGGIVLSISSTRCFQGLFFGTSRRG